MFAATMRAMSAPQLDQRLWLEDLLQRLGITATELARRAGLNPSTLTRFLNEESERNHTLTFRTIRKIEQAVAATGNAPRRINVTGFAESDGAEYIAEQADAVAAAVNAMKAGRNSRVPWAVATADLAGISLAQGDVVVIDMNEEARPGDIVCAQVYDRPAGGARTVFRLYEPPYLITGSTDPGARRPIVVDNVNAVIRGVMIGRITPRRAVFAAA